MRVPQRLVAAFAAGLIGAAVAGCAAAEPPSGPKVVVFFTPWSAAIDPAAQTAINAAAARANAAPGTRVTVTGYADLTGGVVANQLMSATRAQVVVDALEADGVAPERITSSARGRTPSDTLVASRRVEISIE